MFLKAALILFFASFAQAEMIFLGNAALSLSDLPTLEPDSVSSSTSSFDLQESTEEFESELSTITYNEQDIEFVETSGEYGEEIFISTYPIVEPETKNLGGNGNITITRKDTGESITVTYRDKDGAYLEEAFEHIKHIMRCSLEDAEIKTPKLLVEILDAIEDKFGKKGIILLSGYRTKDLNEIVPGAAKQSLHMLGWAADIKIQGYSSRAIKNFARKMEVGGVGYYPTMGFVHVDIGDVRYWERIPKKYRKSNKKKTNKKIVSYTTNNQSSKKI